MSPLACPLPRLLASALLYLSLLLHAPGTLATTLQQLIDEERLSVELVVETPPPLYARSPIIIAVEVATPRWFSRGTRIRDFRVPGAVLRPVSSFADNQTQRRDGEDWSMQRWRYRLFVQEPGAVTLPDLRVAIAVNGGESGNVEGEVTLPGRSLSIELPPGVEGIEPWVTASSLTIEESWEGELEEYQPGDAVTRIRRYRIGDAPAMVLASTPTPEVPGLSLYQAPPQVQDSENRGRLQGLREERLVITFEQPGAYELPGLVYHWRNSSSGDVQRISIPPHSFTVVGAAPVDAPSPADSRHWPAPRTLVAAGAALLLGIALYGLRNSGPIRWLREGLGKQRQRRQMRLNYRSAARQQDSARCLDLLYRRLAEQSREPELGAYLHGESAATTALEALLSHAWGHSSTAPTTGEYATLWQAINCGADQRHEAARLSLNPGAADIGPCPEQGGPT